MHSVLHVSLMVSADSGIETRTNRVLGPTLILGDHPCTVDIDLPTRPELLENLGAFIRIVTTSIVTTSVA